MLCVKRCKEELQINPYTPAKVFIKTRYDKESDERYYKKVVDLIAACDSVKACRTGTGDVSGYLCFIRTGYDCMQLIHCLDKAEIDTFKVGRRNLQ